jgi:pimeloyl-ACP methyl ester carboxylesterase
MRTARQHFVLVHGAWHGAWAWDRLRPVLEREGHRTLAVELPIEDVGVDASGYARVVAGAIDEEGWGDAVLVGHSMAGEAIPLVPALAPVRHLVFLGALIPAPGERMIDVFAREGVLGDMSGAMEVDARGRRRWVDAGRAIEMLYADCEPADASAAVARLRWQAGTPHEGACPLRSFPDVATSYVLMREDRMVLPDWSREAAPGRLGVEPIEIGGGHSPMLANPEGLAELLVRLGAG